MKSLREVALQPVNPLGTPHHFNIGAALVQQSARFKRTLSTPDD
jgi:hypothetical protein